MTETEKATLLAQEGSGVQRYHSLKQRQVKLETEEWERAARECREIMCEQKLAPNLPYLPADMMAVITMHKMMTNAEGVGVVRVVNAATNVGEAIEQEVCALDSFLLMCYLDQARIKSFMQKGKKNKNESHKTVTEAVDASRETQSKDAVKLKKQINTLLKKQKVRRVCGIVKAHDSFKPWGQEAQVKVGAHV
ncbi:hypothetical protein F2Q68_00045788 [Brassica cretica]|uniref:DNA-directed RNA polymerase N-terminal domain-containing protein n=2 Tax=Brassica cretica TaxID=69181 RepID=A0ABQ7ATU0_BRACR|nr:hypothetical protein F2Q68_00045788 [Brassica cretica]KAF3517448.1 hypothetical protein DY000_02062864 [Brassica cretica]